MKYIFVGKNLMLPEFIFTKGTVYYGEKIEQLKEKYPLLVRVLIPIEEYSLMGENSGYYDQIIDEIGGIVDGV